MEQISLPIHPCFYRLSVKALIHNEKGEFFLVQDEFGNWELPGGGVDHEESVKYCAERELLEETGMKIASITPEPLYFITCMFTGKNVENIPVANVIYGVEVERICFEPKEECIDGRFFDFHDAKSLKQSNHTQEFLKHYNPKNHVHL